MDAIRKQLTLFLKENYEIIEQVRATYNPRQQHLIAAPITLCREDELENLDKVLKKASTIRLKNPIKIVMNSVSRYSDGQGVCITFKTDNSDFESLRSSVLGKTARPLLPTQRSCIQEIQHAQMKFLKR